MEIPSLYQPLRQRRYASIHSVPVGRGDGNGRSRTMLDDHPVSLARVREGFSLPKLEIDQALAAPSRGCPMRYGLAS